jgi:hypothetical protein
MANQLKTSEYRAAVVVAGAGARGSYLYLDSEFIESSIDLGRQDAEALFEGVPADVVPWRIGPQQPAVVG